MKTLVSNAASQTKSLLGTAGKIGVPVMAFLAAVADASEPLAPFALLLAVILMLCAGITGAIYHFHFRRQYRLAMADGKMTEEERKAISARNPWSVTSAFCAVGSIFCWLLVGLQQVSSEPSRGVLGSTVGFVSSLQDTLFDIKSDLNVVKADTKEIRETTNRVEGKVDSIASGIEATATTLQSSAQAMEAIGAAVANLGKMGGLVADPKNAAEFVHNARLQAAGGSHGVARTLYERALELGYRPIDVAKEYADAVLASEGRGLAVPIMLRWLDPSGAAYKLESGVPRLVGAVPPNGDVTLSVEAAMAALIPDWQVRRSWLASLSGFGARSLPIWVVALHEVATKPVAERSRADNLLLKVAIDNLQATLPGREVEAAFQDDLKALAVRDLCGSVTAGLASYEPEYWVGKPVLDLRSLFGTLTIRIQIPDVVEKVTVEYRGRTGEEDASPSKVTFNNEGSPRWSSVSIEVRHAKEKEAIKIRYRGTESPEEIQSEFEIDHLAAVVENVKEMIRLQMYVDIDTADGTLDAPAFVSFRPLLKFRHAMKEIRYSLGNPTVDQKLVFDDVDWWTWRAGLEDVMLPRESERTDRSPLRKVTGPEKVVFHGIEVPSRFDGPIFLQIVFKDGAESAIVSYNLENDLRQPVEGRADLERPMKKPSKPPAGAAAPGVADLAAGLSLKVDGDAAGARTEASYRQPYGHEDRFRGPVQHGRVREYHKNGKLAAERLVADGVVYAECAWDESGQLRSVVRRAPLWDGDRTSIDGYLSPSSSALYGPVLVLAEDGAIEKESGDYGNRNGEAPVPLDSWADSHEKTRKDLSPEQLDELKKLASVDGLIKTFTPDAKIAQMGTMLGQMRKSIMGFTDGSLVNSRPGRGLLLDGLPFGWWTEVDSEGRPSAQGWVWHVESPRGTDVVRVGRWVEFDADGKPTSVAHYSDVGYRHGPFIVLDKAGKVSAAGYCRDQSIIYFWTEKDGVQDPDGMGVTKKQLLNLGDVLGPVVGPMK